MLLEVNLPSVHGNHGVHEIPVLERDDAQFFGCNLTKVQNFARWNSGLMISRLTGASSPKNLSL